ncbi:transglutaminase family protein [Micropruina sp.]|uniref:transglutaminase family protein n=1 Tax=Micropruina sp. TaxID=2737536 RepID=UPI0039E4C010
MTEPITEQPAAPDHYAPRRYRVRHSTIYRYDDDVEACYERGFLRPLQTWSQQVLSNDVVVSPDPDVLTEHVDHFGNHSFYVEIRTPHRELVVAKTAFVDVAWPRPSMESLNAFTVADAAVRVGEEADPMERAEYLLPSDLVELGPEVRAYADSILWADRPLGDALQSLYATIYRDFKYELGATSVRTTLPELLKLRKGVCQDFAHLAAGCLRSIGLPARYVSGYVETSPPPGQPKLEGSDASHAWTSVLVPGGEWIDLDPTNDHFADSRYIVTAWGRDFRDVSPLKGVVFTEAKNSTLEVKVDVFRVNPDGSFS